MTDNILSHRRNLLKFLLASPLLNIAQLAKASEEDKIDPDLRYLLAVKKQMISAPEDALNVFDLEMVARNTLPPAHYGYIATGVTDELSQMANRVGYKNIRLRSRRIKDVRDIDTSVTIFGRTWPSPIAVAPTGSHKAFHPDGELAVARAAKSKGQLMMLSNVSSTPIEQVIEARGEPIWSQLYARSHWPSNLAMIKRAEDAGCPVLVITVDLVGAGNRETLNRFIKLDDRDCTACHGEVRNGYKGKPMYDGIDLATHLESPVIFDGDFLNRVRDVTNMKIVVKGITHPDDAKFCLRHGVDGIVVSNHGGRGQTSARATIDILPEIVKAIRGRVPVMVDGGIRRGEDVYKALALGATAVDIGRPYLWGLGAFGQAGVERVLDLLNSELKNVMQQMATTSIDQIKASSVNIIS
tara:strand:- start:354 stop:1589 length:1236 start_codon:yes stop_codon:yes gene_type:complete